jgi:hypothetical protein
VDHDPAESALKPQQTLNPDEAVRAVAASARRLFPLVSEQQARDLATMMLRDLEKSGIRLVRHEVADD